MSTRQLIRWWLHALRYAGRHQTITQRDERGQFVLGACTCGKVFYARNETWLRWFRPWAYHAGALRMPPS